MDREDFVAALDALDAAREAVAALPFDLLTTRELIAVYERRERAHRHDTTIDHHILAAAIDRRTATDYGTIPLDDVLAERLHLSAEDARQRLTDAAQLGPRWTLTGEQLPPEMADTAAALARGDISIDHARQIQEFLERLPTWVDTTTRTDTEHTLAKVAAWLRPHELKEAADHLRDVVDPDGAEPDHEEQQRRRFIRVGRQQRDGMSKLTGLLDPEGRALFDALFASPTATHDGLSDGPSADPGDEQTHGEPRSIEQDDRQPHDDVPPAEPERCGTEVRDTRSQGQRQYDAVINALRLALGSGELGHRHGLPATIVVTTSLTELESAAGYARTGGGTRLPMRDVIRHAGRARHYLAVFDDHIEEPLYLGRAKRCATTAQRLALFARDRGCTAPGCTACFYDCQAHHAQQDWARGGLTDISDLALACHHDNQKIERTEWTTRRRNGRTEWIPPPELDTGQPRTNAYHHPRRFLAPQDDEDPDG